MNRSTNFKAPNTPHPKASWDFRTALDENRLGQAWSPSNSDVSEFAYAFLPFASRLYESVVPKHRTNLAGAAFSYEIQLLSDVALPNAYAFTGQSGGLFVGLTSSLFEVVCRVCHEVFKDDKLYELLTEPINSTLARPRKITAKYLDFEGKGSAIASSIAAMDAGFMAQAPENWRAHYFSCDGMLLAKSFEYRVRDQVLCFVFHHEMAHLIEGHVSLLSSKFGAGPIRESDASSDGLWLREAMEFQADLAATKALAHTAFSRRYFLQKMGLKSDWSQEVNLNLLAIYIVHVILVYMALFNQMVVTQTYRFTGDDFQNAYDRSTSHPSSGARTITSINTFLNLIEASEKNGGEPFEGNNCEPIRAAQILKHLGTRYYDFAMSFLKMHQSEDAFQADRLKIWKGAALTELEKMCQPYTFVGLGARGNVRGQ
jgi:hypothetical protein